ncbi:MAG: type 1 glutamine amidotransferase domain-containing protein [Acidobacteriota bacterium]
MKNIIFGLFSAVLIGALVFVACERKAEEPAIEEAEPVAELEGKRVAVLIAEGFHDGETLKPKAFLEEHGAEVVVLGPAVGEVKAYNSDQVVNIEKAVDEVEVADFDALILPGGQGPAVLREHEAAVAFTKAFLESGKPVAAICHGPQVLITAGVVEGRSMTCTASIADELQEAGAEYLDEPVVVDENLITSRVPDDLPAFNEAILNALKK